MRLIELDDRLYALTEPIPRLQLPQSKRDGMQCLCSSMRPATAEEVQARAAARAAQWKEGREEGREK